MNYGERVFYYLLHMLLFGGTWFLLDLLFGWIFGGEPQSLGSRSAQAAMFGLLMTLYSICSDAWRDRKKRQ